MISMISRRFSEICTALSVDEREEGGEYLGKSFAHHTNSFPVMANQNAAFGIIFLKDCSHIVA